MAFFCFIFDAMPWILWFAGLDPLCRVLVECLYVALFLIIYMYFIKI
jgi:hypothetical protein